MTNRFKFRFNDQWHEVIGQYKGQPIDAKLLVTEMTESSQQANRAVDATVPVKLVLQASNQQELREKLERIYPDLSDFTEF